MRRFLAPSAPRWRWLATLPLLFCVSCSSGSGLNPVTGKVLYKDQPLKGVHVTFHPKEGDGLKVIRPDGLTSEDGTFTLKTGDKEGAAPGTYVVTFICSEEVPLPPGKKMSLAMGPEYEDRFKGAYAEKSASKIEIEVKPGSNQLEAFRLK